MLMYDKITTKRRSRGDDELLLWLAQFEYGGGAGMLYEGGGR